MVGDGVCLEGRDLDDTHASPRAFLTINAKSCNISNSVRSSDTGFESARGIRANAVLAPSGSWNEILVVEGMHVGAQLYSLYVLYCMSWTRCML